MKTNCPICKSTDIENLLQIHAPSMQNKVYESESDAIHCITGVIDLAHCNKCNFSFNASFNEAILQYDQNYDNAVPSTIFHEYYIAICHYLFTNYNLEGAVVYDIGCGKGTFLNLLCSLFPSIKGVGIDPSYEGDLKPLHNLTFIQDFFRAEQVIDAPNLIISRHVFEHIEFPKEFLQIIQEPIKKFRDVPVFIEVPDFGWIVKNKTFWDLCYEHCNYFSEKSLEAVFDNEWSVLNKITKSFGGQYLWVEGIFNSSKNEISRANNETIDCNAIKEFIESIKNSQDSIKRVLQNYKNQKYKIIVWGMATKGVIFSNTIDKNRKNIDYCIDINKEKQNKFSPISAHKIVSPDILETLEKTECLVVVMNINYINEIKLEVAKHHIHANFIDAHGNEL